MFVVGMELDLKVLRDKAQDAVVISHASIIIPFALGMTLAYFVYARFAPEGVQFASFGLFMGIAMSITAFPVLARIVQERGIHRTKLGTMVITCAAADDITAWCLLAAVIAIVKAGSFVSSLYIILLAVGYVVVMLKLVRPFLKRVGDLHASRENLGKPVVAIFFLALLISSYVTEVIGIHALFGAFMAGAIMPVNTKFRNIFIEKVEDVALVLLLPLFFVFTGLRTQIGLLNDPYLWKVTGLIVLVAVVGKFVGSAIAARFVGQNWKDSLTIGALMNTRGLMELVVLNIGYDLGVLTPEIFAMMVIMALVTTLMTGPALDLINHLFKNTKDVDEDALGEIGKFKVLISFGNPEMGKPLLRLAHSIVSRLTGNATITAMHLSPSTELHHYTLADYELQSFKPVRAESKLLGQEITTLFKVSNTIEADIADVANKGDYDLLVIGIGQSIFEGTIIGRLLGFTTRIISPDRILNTVTGKEKLFGNSPLDERTRQIISKCQVPVGIYIDKSLVKVERLLVPLFDAEDVVLMHLIKKLIISSNAHITLYDAGGQWSESQPLVAAVAALEHGNPTGIVQLPATAMNRDLMREFDLMLVSLEGWTRLIDSEAEWLDSTPSTLIVRQ
jgi:Kef-type K+ transport system membrane component KefB